MGTTNTLDLNNRVNALEKAVSGGDSAQANKSDIATEFSATTNYTAGCFVYHGGKLYQFNADHSAGAWDPTDVVEANVTDQVVSNAAAIAGLTATDVAYDNTASGLTATDVQGAVDELRQADNIMMSDGVTSVEDALDELTRKVFTYTADGVKTYAQCYNALFNLCKNTIDVTKWQDINFYQKTGGSVASFVCNAISATQLKFIRSNSDNVNWSIHTISMNENASMDLLCSNTGGTIYTDQAPENGTVFCVIIK